MESNIFKYQHSILLYLVYEGYKCGEVNEDEKVEMKRLIVERNQIIYALLKAYQRDGNPIKFWNSFKDYIYRNEFTSGWHSSDMTNKNSEVEGLDDHYNKPLYK